jgi:hypothetical protein
MKEEYSTTKARKGTQRAGFLSIFPPSRAFSASAANFFKLSLLRRERGFRANRVLEQAQTIGFLWPARP